jgi:hypothetical protein
METHNSEIIELELKYCERCGGLWLRVRGKNDVYCAPCAVQLLESPGGRQGRKKTKPTPSSKGNVLRSLRFIESSRTGGTAR